MDVIHVEFDETQESQIFNAIEQEFAVIDTKRGEINFRENTQKRWDAYNGVKDTTKWKPWDKASDYSLRITTMYCDIMSIKAINQTFGAKPVMLLQPDPQEENPITEEEIREREDRLDYKLREDIKLESLLGAGVYREAIVQGTSFVKVPHSKDDETFTDYKEYIPKDIETYKRESIDREEDPEERLENIKKLQSKNKIKIEVKKEELFYYGPKPYRVPIENLYLRPDIKDLRRQRLIAEKLPYMWIDIQERGDKDFYLKLAVTKLKEETDYDKKDYTLFECIFYTNVNEDDFFQRYVITIEPDSKIILRAILYPYKHRHIYYIPYYIKERDDSVYGYSLADLLMEPNDMSNSLIRASFDRNALDNDPPKLILDSAIDLQAVEWEPGAAYHSKTPGAITLLQMTSLTNNNLKLLQMVQLFTEMVVGISAGYMSGKGDPMDPRAPMGKMAMQLQESNIRISAGITNLQKSNEELSFQIEELILQYSPEDLSYMKDKQLKEIDKDVLKKKVRRVAHGTLISLNKDQELAMVERVINIIFTYFPEVAQMPDAKNMLLKSYINMAGGTIERQKEKLFDLLNQTPQEPQSEVTDGDIEGKVEEAIEDLTPEEQEALKEDLAEINAV